MASRSSRRTLQAGLDRIAAISPERYAELMRRGTLEVGVYAPRGQDPQQPHGQDEVYIVMSGSGYFVSAGTRARFGAGDMLFVPAGMEHRFEDFTDDLVTWVIFYGPEGGEASMLGEALAQPTS